MNNLILVSSNEFKLKEFQRMGLNDIQIEKGKDLKEVDSSPIDVIVYKALEAGENRIVEDTSLEVEGLNVGVNIKWLIQELGILEGRKAEWRVLLGVHNGNTIDVYEGVIKGTIQKKYNEIVGFGFDCFFVPEGQNNTLYDLENIGEKDVYSARKKAIDNLLLDNKLYSVNTSDIPLWNGKYQNE